MRQSARYRVIQLALSASALSVGPACAHRGSSGVDANEVKEARLDSLRAVEAKKHVSSGLQAVDFTESDRNRFNRVEQMIQARFSGVQVRQVGSAYTIRIAGMESFNAGQEPLIVVDGAPMIAADLGNVNAKDVVRIEVLKDAAASMYGVRGGNGVILITTHRIP